MFKNLVKAQKLVDMVSYENFPFDRCLVSEKDQQCRFTAGHRVGSKPNPGSAFLVRSQEATISPAL
jgi:hypothetical protein